MGSARWLTILVVALTALLLLSWNEMFHPRDVPDIWADKKAALNTLLSSSLSCGGGTATTDNNSPIRYAYVDVGGNTGQSVEWFLNGSGSIFTTAFRNKHTYVSTTNEVDVRLPPILDPSRYEIYVFEPNPIFLPNYIKLKERGHNFTLYQAAAGDKDGWINFSGGGQGGRISDRGIASQKETDSDVAAMDFSSWLRRTFTPRDFLICKMDIEGAETRVIVKMILDGTLCFCDRLSVEWHMHVRVPGNTHWFGFNNMGNMKQSANPLAHVNASCHIPHAKRDLDIVECMLPRVTQMVREFCDGAEPLEKWF